MSDFADIEAFGRQHASCGGVTPSATPRAGGGYLLTLTCACGATLERLVTLEEARMPLPLPSSLISPAGGEARRATAAPPAAGPSGGREGGPRPTRAPVAPTVGRRQKSEEAIEREALEILRGVSRAPTARTSTDRLKLESTVRSALAEAEEKTQRPVAKAPPRIVWLVVVGIVAVGAAAAIYLMLPSEAPPVATVSSPPARSPDQQERAALDEVVKALRQLQAASSPSTSFSTYSSRVVFAKSDVDRFIDSTPPGPVRARVREVLDIHLLASAAWRARSLDQKDLWEAVSDDPTIELCPSVKRVVDFAVPPSSGSPRQSRGAVVASSIPLLWECAGQKLTALEQSLGGH
jgi:hypothetical protein